ncbi:hypothetical protein [Marininema halotolerans]|uniref:Uncharacterized protein n=1 Tax=Marininema halotolerans TaxID=1155944 RepID=A0A1I6R9I8_9BACL|nr:hypothetical protein [Marininema halotolerans]SFS61417.1 hypothetical protein SAMN05444972_104309 [Marininema halotolerans]
MAEAQQFPPRGTIIGHRVTVVYTTLRGVRRVRTGTVLRWNARVIILRRAIRAARPRFAVIPTVNIIAVIHSEPEAPGGFPGAPAPAPAVEAD